MNKSNGKKFSVFLSYAEPDLELAEALYELLRSLTENPFFAKKTMLRTGGEKWRDSVLNNIPQSATFLPIFTRNSVRRPWVLFESGVAEATRVPRLPARTASVSMNQIEDIGKDVQVYEISNENSLVELLSNVVAYSREKRVDDTRHTIKGVVNEPGTTREKFERVIELSKDRWVFVAGNTPTEDGIKHLTWLKEYVPAGMAPLDFLNSKLKYFTSSVSSQLFASGFGVMSCPQVEFVGRQTATSYLNHLDSIKNDETIFNTGYKIGGIFPIDRDLRKHIGGTGDYFENQHRVHLSQELHEEWKRHVMEFRQSYLEDMEWLILLGGSVGTREEFEAGMKVATKPCPIPFFGGASFEIWNDMSKSDRPFPDWTPNQAPVSSDQVVEFIKSR